MAVVAVDVIRKKFSDMQLARDNYYAAEAEYEQLEADLMREESRLQGFENELYHFLENEDRPNDAADTATHTDESGTSSGSDSNLDDNSDEISGDGSVGHTGNDACSSVTLLGISETRHDDIHPLYAQLLDIAGDRSLAKEHHDEIMMHRDKILHDLEMGLHRERMRTDPSNPFSEEELGALKSSLNHIPTDPREFRAKFRVDIDQDDLEFLRDYKVEEEKLRRKLEELSHEVRRLVALCREKGVLRKNAPYNEDHAIYEGINSASFLPEGNVAIEPEEGRIRDLSHPRFPVLLSNPSHVLELRTSLSALDKATAGPIDSPAAAQRKADCVKEYGIETLMGKVLDNNPEYVNKLDFINKWLIQRLRTSPLEVELMLSIFEESFKIRNLRRWQEDVLYFWRRDEAASRLPDDFHGPITSRGDLESNNSIDGVNSAVLASVRARSDVAGHSQQPHHHHDRQVHRKMYPGPSTSRSLP
ncbi:hypothetical protein B0T16DRAFT_454177 [Cercophora newfieldiana]|uniref:Uncharacterized protein n=1 Tax=Cercophora newfieldiana TaxID=92897 RepID=A0AA39YIP9_9PEZI|nr:hypothetical protein B0T16DRAFT_454177 [Cercophora newfieldiana]